MRSTTFLLFLATLWQLQGAMYEGDSCSVGDTPGYCLNLRRCPEARSNIQKGKKPQICSFATDGITPLVCCVDSVESTTIPRDNDEGERISFKKCNEYTNLVLQRSLVSSGKLIISSSCVPSIPLIVGGEKAKSGEFPHMAALGWTSNGTVNWRCAGSIISERWILSAAHCKSSDSSPDVARLGSHSLSNPNAGFSDYKIDNVLTPQNYSLKFRYNDILLLRVDRDIRFNQNIRPACLWPDDQINKTTAEVIGWGKTTFDSEASSDDLMKVELDIFDNSICNENYKRMADRKSPRGVIDSQLCAGDLAGGKDACQGDSGGPLQVTHADYSCVYYLIGITSFGTGCAAPDTPGIYTRVSSYIDWIEEIVWK